MAAVKKLQGMYTDDAALPCRENPGSSGWERKNPGPSEGLSAKNWTFAKYSIFSIYRL